MTAASPMPDEPADFDSLLALALGHHRAGRLAEADAAYRAILALRPDVAEVHRNLAGVLRSLGKLDEAAARYRQALALRPDSANVHNDLANMLQSQGKLDEAVFHYQQALALRPNYADALNNLGNALSEQGKLDEAVARFEQAIALRPQHARAHYNLGNTLRRQGKLDEAAARFAQAIALRPDFAEAHYNLGNTLKRQGRLDQAVACFEQAAALRPDHAGALKNLGLALQDQLKLAEARQVFQRLLALHPDLIDAQVSLAACYLLDADYERGWPAYEARLAMPKLASRHKLPRWKGEPLIGRSLVLSAEQGLGDTIQFVRYARLLKQRGARVVLACPKALGRLLTRATDVDEVFVLGPGEEPPHCDFYLPLPSAPGALGTTAATIPHDVPYLSADPALAAQWRRELADIEGFKIGIAWQGARTYALDRWRSIPLAHFAPLARLPGVRLISLQKGFGSEQIAAVDFPVLDLSARLDEVAGGFMDTTAVIGAVDLVVTSDTSIAHLAGALAAPVWVTLPFSPDWRWLSRGEASPWYPTMQLFRQTANRQWADVFERIAKAVAARRAETVPETDSRNGS
ncbi:MAG TPA: tetratricopeptide repeat protein [Pirellulales bacterium]|jgi:tetratricopeptide (TPR) repeat protein|nr:tetratricopeptide repeat protein [Pirellulales bacterium]